MVAVFQTVYRIQSQSKTSNIIREAQVKKKEKKMCNFDSFRFPEDRDSWMNIICQQVKGFSYKPNSKLCSLHFHRNVLAPNNKLREGALPRFFRLTGNSLEASVKRCCIMGCNSTSNTTAAANFFQFPEDKVACAAWLNAIRLKNFQNIIPNQNKYLCGLHFPAGTPAAMIHKAVPSIFFRKRLLNGDIIQRTEEQKADKAGPEAAKKMPTETFAVEKKLELM